MGGSTNMYLHLLANLQPHDKHAMTVTGKILEKGQFRGTARVFDRKPRR